jgi:hypothetical protein
MKRTLIATFLAFMLVSTSAWSAKSPPLKHKPEHAVAKADRGKSKPKRAPASSPKFICEEPEVVENQQALVAARFLNEKCDSTKSYTVTMTNPGSTFPITICCVSK